MSSEMLCFFGSLSLICGIYHVLAHHQAATRLCKTHIRDVAALPSRTWVMKHRTVELINCAFALWRSKKILR